MESLRTDVQRKVGRNVVVYQQVEAMINFLAAYGNFPDDEHVLPGSYLPHQLASGFDTLRKRVLLDLAKDRYELVHQFLANCNWSSADSLLRAGQILDARMAVLQPDIECLEGMVKDQQEAMSAWTRKLDSMSAGEMLKEHAALLKVLDDYARMMPGHEKWVPVFDVDHRLTRAMPVEMTALEEAYGSPCLLSLIRSCGLFEVRAVETGSGPEYWYRLKKIETAASR